MSYPSHPRVCVHECACERVCVRDKLEVWSITYRLNIKASIEQKQSAETEQLIHVVLCMLSSLMLIDNKCVKMYTEEQKCGRSKAARSSIEQLKPC